MQKQEVINHLKTLASQPKHRKYITAKDVHTVPKLGYYIYVHFRTLGKALRASGLPSSQLAASMSISSEDLLNYLRDLKKELGKTPTVWDVTHDEKIYKKYSEKKFSWKIFKSRFGGFKKAIELIEARNVKDIVESKTIETENINDEALESSQGIDNKGKFWGRAAELHVTAELLYRGFQAANIPVDTGLDILAVKKNKTFYFQVKHKDLSNKQAIELTKSSFERSGGGDVYYIFVLLSDKKREFLIIPYHIVNDWIRAGLAEDKGMKYLIYIQKDEDGKYKLNEMGLDKYRDRWEDIK